MMQTLKLLCVGGLAIMASLLTSHAQAQSSIVYQAATYEMRGGNPTLCFEDYHKCVVFSGVSPGRNYCSEPDLQAARGRSNIPMRDDGDIGGIEAVRSALSRDTTGLIFAEFQDCYQGLGYWHGVLCIDVDDNAAEEFYGCGYVTEVDRWNYVP